MLIAATPQVSFGQSMTLPGKFSVGSSGSATYNIPIAVPPGTAGLAPSLSLEYNSQGSSGLLGIGWSLGGLPSIGRCPQTIAQDGALGAINFNNNDRFCMDGQRLVLISGTYGADGAQYRTEVETFSEIISHGTAGNGPAWFEVHTKSGQIMQFGNTTDSQVLAKGTSTARSWALNKVSDTKGNYFTVTYTNDTTNGQAYPIEIGYTGNTAASLSPNNKVQFVYATRPDIAPQYQAGSLSRTTVRMTDVKTFSGSTLVADYRLAYQSVTTVSLLASIAVCDTNSSCMPSTTLQWTPGTTGQYTLTFRQSNYPNDGVIWRSGTDSGGSSGFFADVNGDGKADLVQIANGSYQAQVLLSNGDGTFHAAFTQTSSANGPFWRGYIPTNGPTDGVSTFVGDVNGDGKADLVQIANGSYQAQVLLSNGDGTFHAAFTQTSSANGPFWRAGGDVVSTYFADVNGDGKADIIQIETQNYEAQVLLSNGDGTFRVAFAQTSSANGPFWRGFIPANGPTDGCSTFPADVDGDGKADLIQIANGSYQAQVLLSNGDGTFRRAYQEQNYPTDGQIFRSGFDSGGYSTFIADVNGDGKADIVQISNGTYQAQVLLSNGDGTFRRVYQEQNYPNDGVIWRGAIPANGPTDGVSTFLADVDADGKADLIQIGNGSYQAQVLLSNGDGTFRRAYSEQNYPTDGQIWRAGSDGTATYVGSLTGDGKAEIIQIQTQVYGAQVLTPNSGVGGQLTSITSGLGATTAITYAPLTSSSVYTKDTTSTYPVQDFQAPIYVVSQVSTSNGIGGTYSSSYSYAGAKLDLTGRGFLGYRQMTVKDLQTGVTNTTNYRQDFPYLGLVASTTQTAGTQTLGQSTNIFQFSNVNGSTTISPSSAPYRVSLSQNVSSGSDLDGSVLPSVTTSNQYDALGNATQIVVSTSDGFSKTTNNTYSNDTTNWYLGRLTQSSVTSVSP